MSFLKTLKTMQGTDFRYIHYKKSGEVEAFEKLWKQNENM